MRALFQQLVSPEQKRLFDAMEEKGGAKALRDNDKALLALEKSVIQSSGQPGAEGHRTRQTKLSDADLEVADLRKDIFEDPNAAAEKNWTFFSRKFEVQKNQIIDELTRVVQRESDRVIREMHGSAQERIRDRVGFRRSSPYSISNRLVFLVGNSRDLGRNGKYFTISPSIEYTELKICRPGEGTSRLDTLFWPFVTTT